MCNITVGEHSVNVYSSFIRNFYLSVDLYGVNYPVELKSLPVIVVPYFVVYEHVDQKKMSKCL